MTTALQNSETTTPSQSQFAHPKTKEFIGNIIACHGNLAVAQERTKLSQADVVTILNDPAAQQEINGAIRARLTLSAFEALDDMATVLPTMLAGVDPNDAFKAFSSLIQAVAALTQPPKNAPSLIQNNNTFNFDKSDAEAARGKLIDFVTSTSKRLERETLPANTGTEA